MRTERSEAEQGTPPEDVDVAVILTNYADGDLVKRSIRKALERDVEIVGGRVADAMLAADGAAIAAFKRLESWHKIRGYHQDEVVHNEL